MKRVGAGQVLKVSTLASTVLALRRIGLSFVSKSEHMPELEEALSSLARTKIATRLRNTRNALARFLRSLHKSGEIGGHAGVYCGADRAHFDADGRGGQTRPEERRLGRLSSWIDVTKAKKSGKDSSSDLTAFRIVLPSDEGDKQDACQKKAAVSL
jgi:hypothetical protein